MPDRHGWHPVPAPRALAELPLQAALTRAPQLAGAWALALIRSRSLQEMERVPLGELGRDGPGFCEQLIGAIHSDAELERLSGEERDARAGGGSPAAGRLWALSGARDAAEAVQALELLRELLCEALAAGLATPGPRQSADLCERVAHVCSTVLALALREQPGREAHAPRAGAEDGEAGGSSAPARSEGASGRDAGRALIVDELESAVAELGSSEPGGAEPVAAEPAGAGLSSPRPAPAQVGSDEPSQSPEEAPEAIEIRDQRSERDARSERGAVAWLGAIARQLERFEADGVPFAALLVELREIERLRLETSPAELAALGTELERVLAGELSGTGASRESAQRGAPPWGVSLSPQRPGRCWLLAPETDRRAARALADRLSRAAAGALRHRGAPLEALVGIAVCPQDGRQAAALAAHADIDLHAARAARR